MRCKGGAAEVEGGDTGRQQKSDNAHQIPHSQEVAPPLPEGGHTLSHGEVNNQDHQDELREGKKWRNGALDCLCEGDCEIG